ITATAPAGAGTVDVRVTTTGGTSATSAADQFTYVGAPTVSAISPSSGPATGGTTVTLTGTNFSGTTAVTFGATAATGFTVNSATQITATAPAGTGTVDVRVTTTGGTSATSAADQFTYVGAPTVSGMSPSSGPATGGTTVTLNGTNFSGTTAVTFGATAATGFTVNSATQITATAPAGTGTVDVRVTTTGGTSATSAADQFTYVGAPTVSSISPSSGPATGGTTVTLNGTNFSGTTAVTFGATAATGFTVNSATQITATAPAGAGTVDVRVTTTGGTSATSAADRFTYVGAPTVSSISPSSGPATGGTTVTLTGTNFSGTTAVTFGATAATGFTVNSATQITATAPAGTGTVDVRVTSLGGTSVTSAADQFTYVTAPTLTSISPNSGPTAGGTSVTVNGSGFTGATAVSFGGNSASAFTVNSASQITATAPAGSGTVDVRVTTTGGTTATSAADQFTYANAPTIASLAPAVGPTTGGTVVTLSGGGFTGATAVNFGGNSASAFTVNSASQITATAPAGTGTVDVRVTTPGGSSAPAQFTYINVAVGPVSATVAYGSSANPIALNLGSFVPTSVTVASAAAHGTATASGTGISYTPTPGYAGTDTFTYTATNAAGTSAPATVSITVTAPVQNTTASGGWSTGGGQAYSQTLTWHGGAAPYSAFNVSGLPAGLSMTATTATSLTIAGTPTQTGTFTVTATATDSSTGSGPFAAPATFTLTVGAAPPLTLTPGASTLNATHGSAFTQAFSVSGGIAPYTLAQGGNLPAGVSWNGATATLSGTPSQSGSFAITLTATDGSTGTPGTVTQHYTLQVADETPVAPSQAANSAGPGQPVEVDLTNNASGGPFIAANLLTSVPASVGRASIHEAGAGAANLRAAPARVAGKRFVLRFVPNPDASGVVNLSYTLSNASLTSSPGLISISLSARSDPSKDAEVQGLLNAQANSSRRFASGQINNFQQRLEALHSGNVSPFSNGFTLSTASLKRQRLNDDPTGIEQWLQIKNAKMQAEPSLRTTPSSEQMPALGNQPGDAPTSPLAFWTSGTISIGDDAKRSADKEQKFVTSGLSVGADYRWAPNLTLGVGLGYGHDKTDIGDNGSRSQADSYSVAVYGSYRPIESIYLDGVLGYQRLSFDNRRYVTDNAGVVNGKRDGNQTFASLTAGYEYREAQWLLSPYARLDLADGKLDRYRERGDDIFALSYDEQKVKTTSTSLGLRSQYATSTALGEVTPSLRLEYQHDFQGAGDASMRYADNGSTQYRVSLAPLSQDRGMLGLGLGLLTESDWTLRMEYQFTLGSGAQQTQSMLFNLGKPF
ncbi:IPT/TIG domain-containing protein, partial [Pseudomonas sp. Irchel 3E20]|uniref:IPT/TIG domain-containing protein n=1 Tax=Pseudomonas sp. Irchel 3E20 TaxID=2008983 RepID=UPI001594EC39